MIDILRKRIDHSNAIISQMLSLCEKTYVALSFGKDSLLMSDLVFRQNPNAIFIFSCSNETLSLDRYQELIDYYREEMGWNIIVSNFDRYSISQDSINVAGNVNWAVFNAPIFFDGWDGMFMGLRIEESKIRRISLVSKQNNIIGDKIMRYDTGKRTSMLRCCPVAYWKHYEVLHYLKEMNMPMLEAYDAGSLTRTSIMVTHNSLRSGVLQRVKRTNIERYNELLAIMPEIKYL